MKSILDDLPKNEESREEFALALDRFIADRRLYMTALDDDELASAVALLLQRLSACSEKPSSNEDQPTERLVRSWLRRRLLALREACEQFRAFVRHERSSRPAWSLLHFIGNWFLAERHLAIADVVLIFEAIVSKAVDDQERVIGPAVKTVVRRIRALEKAAAALKAEIEVCSIPDKPPFWPSVVDGLTAAVRHTMGNEAARATSANMDCAFPALAAPFLALLRFTPQWEGLIAMTHHLADDTIGTMQENFTSATLGSAYAPEKRGLRFRIGLLHRAGFSAAEIGDFERITPEAAAEHLRRLRLSPKTA
jgi:hypothetical protein